MIPSENRPANGLAPWPHVHRERLFAQQLGDLGGSPLGREGHSAGRGAGAISAGKP
jgi:hypothetical protein